MYFRAVLFDLDGTLLDTLEDIADSMNRVLLKNGFPEHAIDAYRSFVGDGAEIMIKRALPGDSQDKGVVGRCLEDYYKEYRRNRNSKTRLYPGIGSLLDELRERRLKLAILSNKAYFATKECVNEFLSHWSFDVVLGQNDSIPLKPDPAGAHYIAEKFRLSPENIIYLGDTEVDMKTAMAAGMFPVGVLWGFRSMEELKNSGAKELIRQPWDLIKIIDNIC